MFFILSKIALFFITPSFWIAFFLVMAFFAPNEKKRKRRLIISLVLIFFFSNKIIFNMFVGSYESNITTLNKSDSFEVAVVLGGFSNEDLSRNRLQFNEAADRFIYGLKLLNQNKVRYLLVSGGNASMINKDAGEGKPAAELLKQLKADSNRILFENKSRNTAENAKFTNELLMHKGIKGKILLVTSAFHMPRAIRCFQKIGLEVTPYPVHFSSIPISYFSWYEWIIPDAYPLFKWEYLLKEWVGFAAYKVKGYI